MISGKLATVSTGPSNVTLNFLDILIAFTAAADIEKG